MAKQGSVILVVLMILSVLAIVGFTILRNTSFLLDGALAREQYIKHYYATEALMRYGISIGQCYFDQFKKQEKEITININAWPLDNSLETGKLSYMPDKYGIKIQSLLEHNKDIICIITCTLVHNQNFEVRDWCIN